MDYDASKDEVVEATIRVDRSSNIPLTVLITNGEYQVKEEGTLGNVVSSVYSSKYPYKYKGVSKTSTLEIVKALLSYPSDALMWVLLRKTLFRMMLSTRSLSERAEGLALWALAQGRTPISTGRRAISRVAV